ncbi:putative serine/threonine-protein kinase [Trypanosoma vivax]|nr:putative serine/threonine-protein kinase [Trypanosoma vivax]
MDLVVDVPVAVRIDESARSDLLEDPGEGVEDTYGLTLAGYTHICQVSRSERHVTLTARSRTTKELVRIRVYALECLRRSASLRDRVERSVLVGRMAQHPRIVRGFPAFVSRSDLFVVEEHCIGGDLLTAVKSKCRCGAAGMSPAKISPCMSTCFPMDFVRSVMRDVTCALHYLHNTCGVAHRGIKLESIFLDGSGRAKLGHLSSCAAVRASRGDDKSLTLHLCCAPQHYVAPEVVLSKSYDGELVDVWAAGVVLFVLLTCRFPFVRDSSGHTPDRANVEDDKLQFLRDVCCADDLLSAHPALARVPDPLAVDLVRNMLRVSCKSRLTVEEVLQHPFLT